MVGRWWRKAQQAYYTRRVRRTAHSCGPGLVVNGPSRVSRATRLGRCVSFNGVQVNGEGEVVIGDYFHSGPELLIITHVHDYDGGEWLPYGRGCIQRTTVIEDCVWVGSRVIILGGVRIGEGAIIQAGSCVVGDIPKGAIAGGHPARVFKQRDMAHYEQLKKERKFHPAGLRRKHP